MTEETKPSFNVPPHIAEYIECVANRAQELGLAGPQIREVVLMDMTAAHANGCPMDWRSMLLADDASFTSDFCGIRRHIDRTTGRLGFDFAPKFAKRRLRVVAGAA